jgi:homoserine kinase
LPTERARAALPSTLTLEDVVWNTRRLSLLLEGLRSGEPELLRLGSEDRLHTPHRLPLIPGAARALEAALAAGAWMSAISGSGSGLIALQDDEHRAREIAAAMATELERENEWVEVRCLRAARVGAQLVPGSSSDI